MKIDRILLPCHILQYPHSSEIRLSAVLFTAKYLCWSSCWNINTDMRRTHQRHMWSTQSEQQQQQQPHHSLASLSFRVIIISCIIAVYIQSGCGGGGSVLITARQRPMKQGECAILLPLTTDTVASGQRTFQRRPAMEAFMARRV